VEKGGAAYNVLRKIPLTFSNIFLFQLHIAEKNIAKSTNMRLTAFQHQKNSGQHPQPAVMLIPGVHVWRGEGDSHTLLCHSPSQQAQRLVLTE